MCKEKRKVKERKWSMNKQLIVVKVQALMALAIMN